jgi:hypothetical protein
VVTRGVVSTPGEVGALYIIQNGSEVGGRTSAGLLQLTTLLEQLTKILLTFIEFTVPEPLNTKHD